MAMLGGLQQLALGYDPKSRMEPRDIVSSKEAWSEYTLDDGSIIRVKGVLLDAKRAVNQFSPDGDPLYVMQITMVNQLRASEKLRKDYKPEGEK